MNQVRVNGFTWMRVSLTLNWIRRNVGIRIVVSRNQQIGVIASAMAIQTIHMYIIQSDAFASLDFEHSAIVGTGTYLIRMCQAYIGSRRIECSVTFIVIGLIGVAFRPTQRMSTRITIQLQWIALGLCAFSYSATLQQTGLVSCRQGTHHIDNVLLEIVVQIQLAGFCENFRTHSLKSSGT